MGRLENTPIGHPRQTKKNKRYFSSIGEEGKTKKGLKMSLSRFLSRSLPVERLLDPEEPGAAGGGGEYLRRNIKSEKYMKKK